MQGLDEELNRSFKEECGTENVVDFGEEKKRRKLFHVWEVGDKEYKLKLTTSNICMLEEKYKRNLLDLISMGSIPPLSTMLTIFQAAMLPWHHGIKYKDVQNIYGTYVDEGGSQSNLVTDVLMPTLAVSGFFTQDQAELMEEEMQSEKLL